MKALVCEMCNSQDLVKQDGMFVCQHCGCKYSVEEARKMMIDGTVNVVGTVTIDNSASYDRIIELARDAFTDKRFESAYDYYCQAVDIKQNLPENVLRQGLSILAKDGIQSSVPSSCVNRVARAVDLIKAMPDGKEKNDAVFSAMEDVKSACSGAWTFLSEEISDLELQKMKTRSAGDILADLGRPQFVVAQNQAEDKKIERHNKAIDEKISAVRARGKRIDEFKNEYLDKLIDCADINTKFKYYYAEDLSKAAALYGSITMSAEEQRQLVTENNKLFSAVSAKNVDQVYMLLRMGANVNQPGGFNNCTPLFQITAFSLPAEKRDAAIKILYLLLDYGAYINPDEAVGQRTLLNTDTDEEIKRIIISRRPDAAAKITEAPKKSGCYVATAVYGSYDCPEVWTLRRFRDNMLAKSWLGRAFIRTYYAISPTLVKWFGKSGWFKNMWKPVLDRMVLKLRAKGVEATAYNDRAW